MSSLNLINNYLQLTTHFEQIGHLNNLLGIIHWDYSVNLPKKSAASRQQEITTLSSVVHKLLTCETVANLIVAAEQETTALNMWQQANFREMKRQFLHASCISAELQARHCHTVTNCEFVWREARQNNDFNLLRPHLQQVVDITKEIAGIKAEYFNMSKYDVLIDSYDPDSSSSEIKSVYAVLKQQLPQLLEKILAKQRQEKSLPITELMSVSEQKMLGKKIMEAMGFDFARGRLDESTHPFCGGTAEDVRLTTRYEENNFLSGLLGVIHETGHGLYELNLPIEYRNQPAGKAKGMAFHESQSLIMEMQAAKSREFTEFLAKTLRDELGLRGAEYSGTNIYQLLTLVKPDFIRVDADEVTYPLHVIMRFELEEAFIEGDLTVDDLPMLWNQKMREYLGIIPNSYQEGCLQDIHWPWGAFGYFPSYTNGAIIAAQLMARAKKVYPDISSALQEGDFSSLNLFLTQNLRQYGSLKTSRALLQDATGYDTIQPEIFMQYLTNKYL